MKYIPVYLTLDELEIVYELATDDEMAKPEINQRFVCSFLLFFSFSFSRFNETARIRFYLLDTLEMFDGTLAWSMIHSQRLQ